MNDKEEEIYEEEVIEEIYPSSTDDVEIQNQQSSRQQVDQVIDGTNTKILEDLGVPEPIAKTAVKTNGGPFSPTNLPANKMANNAGRNALANSPIFNKTNQNDSNRLNQVLNKKETGMSRLNQNKTDNSKEKSSVFPKLTGLAGGFGGMISSKLPLNTGTKTPSKEKIIAELAKKLLIKKVAIIFIAIAGLFLLIIFPIITIFDNSESNAATNDSDYSQSTGGTCSYKVFGKELSNIKVRLLKCPNGNETGGDFDLIDTELIDFEKYVLGVAYQEIGTGNSVEAIKAQAIAIRNFTLNRNSGNRIKNENGQWIIEMRTCTYDQAYCDPDNGCHSAGVGGEGGNTIYSGSTGGVWNKPKLTNQDFIDAVASTSGQVAVNKNGTVAGVNFCAPETNLFSQYAREGLNALEILRKVYDGKSNYQGSGCGDGVRPEIVSINSNCQAATSTSTAEGEFKNWKQCGESWSNDLLGTSKTTTICNAGCAATSVAIQLAKSGTDLTFNNLNPGTFVKEYTKAGGFSGALIYFGNVNKIAPKFKHVGAGPVTISGSKKEKADQLNKYASDGEYLVIGVYKSATASSIGHWVAFDSATGDTVYINDPGQRNLGNKLFDIYPYTVTRNIVVHRYKLSG